MDNEVPVCTSENGVRYCISDSSLCDGVQDCTNGEDELFPYCADGKKKPPFN